MFPFVIRGKVYLGLRRDFQLSVAGLEERIAERLVGGGRKSQVRVDGSPSGDGRGFLAGGISRLRTMGLLSAVKVRKISILSRKDDLFALYEMDSTVSTLINLVIIPLVLGSILFSHPRFGFYESLALLLLLVATSWGLDIFVLVMMVRHEIVQVASEIRAVIRRRDTPLVDAHHQHLSPEDLLATAYYYERNGLILRCEAYLFHLVAQHPDTLEADLAREHMETLEGLPRGALVSRTREGEKRPKIPEKRDPSWVRRLLPSGKGSGNSRGPQFREGGQSRQQKEKTLWRRLLDRWRPAGSKERARREDRGAHGLVGRWRRKGLLGVFRRERKEERVLRKRRERLQRRDGYMGEVEEGHPGRKGLLRRVLGRLRWETREERQYRREQERWKHGPPPPRGGRGPDHQRREKKRWRPSWLRSREEKEVLARRERWLQGDPGPGSFQRGRDRWARWRLVNRENREERSLRERQTRALDDTPRVET